MTQKIDQKKALCSTDWSEGKIIRTRRILQTAAISAWIAKIRGLNYLKRWRRRSPLEWTSILKLWTCSWMSLLCLAELKNIKWVSQNPSLSYLVQEDRTHPCFLMTKPKLLIWLKRMCTARLVWLARLESQLGSPNYRRGAPSVPLRAKKCLTRSPISRHTTNLLQLTVRTLKT